MEATALLGSISDAASPASARLLAFPAVQPDPAVAERVALLRRTFAAGVTRPLDWRRAQLLELDRMLVEHERAFLDALRDDLGKGEAEALTTELAFVRAEAKHMAASLGRWAAPERVGTPWFLQPARSRIVREPLGVVLVIGAWNMPVPVLLGPALAALAAGNAVALKPSELAPATSALIARLVPAYLDERAVAVVEGGVLETTALLEQRFDHIFYTGNGRVGRIVAAAAAQHLTPATLELGGKSPAYVHRSADIAVTARRLAWAKWINAGQVCVSPDHVLVDEAVKDQLVEAVTVELGRFYGADPSRSPDYGRIVNARHHDRLTGLLRDHGGRVVHGGGHDREALHIEPTIVVDPDASSPLMQEEIFGPILPVCGVADADAGIDRVLAGPKPLALHVFAREKTVAAAFEASTSSGALLVNDAVINHRAPGLPFGGVGESGYGSYHGRFGFETFSHRKAVFRRPFFLDAALRYPPYTPAKLRAARRLLGI